mmetsp:Transcript_56697/g.64974  ORF Transcript_56697/g.64974 Transcript_56697/m.64974 type:complete len:172 (+) Transcript_56697:72-587(+)
MAFQPTVVEAAVQALVCPVSDMEQAAVLMDTYTAAVMNKLRECQDEIQALCHCAVRDGLECMSLLSERADSLEALFVKIDALQQHMDVVHELVLSLNGAVKAIEAPADVKERAANFLKSFGLRSKVVDENASAKHAWGRVPQFLMLDGSTPSEFLERVHLAVEALSAVDES